MKICTKCLKELDETLFYKQKGGKNGLAGQCKKCRLAKIKECQRRPESIKKRKDRMKIYRRTDEYREKQRIYRQTPRGKEVL